MKEPNWSSCNEEQLWKYVASHLSKNGIDTVLVGGAVVAIYSDGAYQSGDLDFVLLTYLSKELPEIMKKIGFQIKNSRHYSHPKCKHLIIEFTSTPLGIGDDHKITPTKVKVNGTIIKIYSPTDCIRDRLASYIHFKALECLDQATLVAQKHPFNLSKIKTWCKKEDTTWAFLDFKKKLETLKLK